MKWNWEHKNWPNFRFKKEEITQLEVEFIFNSGLTFGVYKHLDKQSQENLTIELIASEAFKTSEIEGETLNRDSLQSSIKRSFNLATDAKKIPAAEKGISDMMIDLYRNFDDKLTHTSLFRWHEMLTNGRKDLKIVKKQMSEFIAWFNDSQKILWPLTRASIAHLYFYSLSGNRKIARALAIKALSQSFKQPLLTSLSTIIEAGRKEYYKALKDNNQNLEISDWINYFAKTFLESQNHTQKLIEFLLSKTQLYDKLYQTTNLLILSNNHVLLQTFRRKYAKTLQQRFENQGC